MLNGTLIGDLLFLLFSRRSATACPELPHSRHATKHSSRNNARRFNTSESGSVGNQLSERTKCNSVLGRCTSLQLSGQTQFLSNQGFPDERRRAPLLALT